MDITAGSTRGGGWIYSGPTAGTTEYIDKNGRRWHSRQISVSGIKRQFGTMRSVPKPSSCILVKCPGKHRYLMPLDAEIRRRILPLSKPYPIRARSRYSAASGFQSEDGSACATPALQ